MEFVTKAAFDTVAGALYARQDLSPTISLTSTRPRPVSQNAPQNKATNTIHQWVEQGRNGVAGKGGSPVASYAEGALPNTGALAPNRPQNTTANLGLTAQVTEVMAAVWNGGGKWQLDVGSEVKAVTEAMDEQVELATLDVLDFLEWMHISGDSSNPQGFAGLQFDGLLKWITLSGVVANTGGSGSSSGAVQFQPRFLTDGARASAELFPSAFPDTMLVPPELIPDINALVAAGSGRPVTITVDGNNPKAIENLVAGTQVGFFNTGFSLVKIHLEPDLSPAFNPVLINPAIIMYNKIMVKNSSLIKLEAVPLALTDTSIRKMVRTTVTQEHRVPQHAIIVPNIASAVA